MSGGNITVNETPLVSLPLRRADDALILGHRLSEWSGHAPTLEEELALANLGLDLIGQARSLYSLAATREAAGHSEDDFAFRRDAPAYRNILLVEQPNGDFAHTMVRHLFFAAHALPFWKAMALSTDDELSAIAAKAAKELAYHLRHASEWTIRLGDGTLESHARTQAAVDSLWSFTGELFDLSGAEQTLISSGTGVDCSALRDEWNATVDSVLREATLIRPAACWMRSGGRAGRHTEHLGHLLAVMQHVHRSFPGVRW